MYATKRCNQDHVLQILQATINAVLPNTIIGAALKKDTEGLWVAGKCHPLKSRKISLVGFGKAVTGMARAVQDVLGDDLHSGILSVPFGTLETLRKVGKSYFIPGSKIKIYEGAENNLPDSASKKAADEILKFVKKQDENNLLIVLISGGGSALLPAPIPPVTLEEKHQLTKLLANCGADIQELNTVRRKLSNIKGGKLALAATPAQVISLILSDVVGNPLEQIASGPTIPMQDGPSNAMEIIHKYKLINKLPPSVQKILKEATELTRAAEHYDHVTNYLIGSNALALQEAHRVAGGLGYAVCNLSTTICGEAKAYGQLLAEISGIIVRTCNDKPKMQDEFIDLEMKCAQHGICTERLKDLQLKAHNHIRLALLSGGETVVNVAGNGCGGRNQEMVLSYSINLHKILGGLCGEDFKITLLSAGTDGQDGPTDAAGAIAYLGQLTDMEIESGSPDAFLLNNDSNTFFKKLKPDDLIVTGITGTNVMDIQVLLIEKAP